jgi:hypothetical protein
VVSDDGVSVLDGNSIAGPLEEIFATDMTVAVGRCGQCDWSGPLARISVYAAAPGSVGRCPGCENVLLRICLTPRKLVFEMSGLSSVEVSRLAQFG